MDAWISMCNMLIRNCANLSVYQIESSRCRHTDVEVSAVKSKLFFQDFLLLKPK